MFFVLQVEVVHSFADPPMTCTDPPPTICDAPFVTWCPRDEVWGVRLDVPRMPGPTALVAVGVSRMRFMCARAVGIALAGGGMWSPEASRPCRWLAKAVAPSVWVIWWYDQLRVSWRTSLRPVVSHPV